MNRFLKVVGGLLLATTLAACGGGGGSAGSTGGNNGGGNGGGDGGGSSGPAVATLDVFTSATTLSSAANSSITFTVLPKDANNQIIPDQAVSFAASSGSLAGALPTPTTSSTGGAITGVSLSPGADRSNRDITVTLTSGGITKTVVIPVVGTSLTLSGDSFVLQGTTTTFTARAIDSAGAPVANATLTVSSSKGNGVAPATLTTNALGVATFTYTATSGGADTLTLAGLGATATAPISVSVDEFRFLTPASNASIDVGTSQTFTVRFRQSGVPVVGQTVNFSTTRGSVSSSAAVTDAMGRASVTVSSTSAGPANIVAQTGTSQVTLPVTFVATVPATLVLQANPSAVAPNTGVTTTSQAALSAIVRDATGNPVSGRVVTFTALTDPSAGSISPGTATTDASGAANVTFTPGSGSTANNGVVVRATVQGTAVSGTTSLTVNASAVAIAIATGNEITNFDTTTYEKTFSVSVSDVNGAAVAGKVVTLSVVPTAYGKGKLVFSGGRWVIDAATSFGCVSEDTNRNGSLDGGEDINGDGTLQPGNPTTLSVSSITTDSHGYGTFTIRYGENFAPWLQVLITATTNVGGTESVRSQSYTLEGLSTDFSNESVAPAGVTSPYGVNACNVPN